jgi:hypothetical protein
VARRDPFLDLIRCIGGWEMRVLSGVIAWFK